MAIITVGSTLPDINNIAVGNGIFPLKSITFSILGKANSSMK